MSRRPYDNSGRVEGARATRRRILESARGMLVAEGFPGLSIAALAAAAEVSPQTIYNSIGGKAQVLKACYDITLAGDDETVPMSQRPAFRAIFNAPDARTFLTRYAAWVREVYARVGPILAAVVRPGAGDPAVAGFLSTIEAERRTGTTHAMTALRDAHGLPAAMSLREAVDIAWTLNSPEVYDRLVGRCEWSGARYQDWLAGQLRASLVD